MSTAIAESKQIGANVYHVTPLGFRKQRALLVKLGNLYGAATVQIALQAGSLKALASIEGAADALTRALQTLDDSFLTELEELFGECTQVTKPDGKRPLLSHAENREALFAGDLFAFFAWLAFCLEVNYAPFFRALLPPKDAGSEAGTRQ